jgi:hypothetical protein
MMTVLFSKTARALAVSRLAGRGKCAAHSVDSLPGRVRDRGEVNELAVVRGDHGDGGCAKLLRGLCDRVEHRPNIGRRARDDAQDVVRGRLVRQRLGEVAIAQVDRLEKANVLDRDRRLARKCLDQCDLVRREQSRLAAPQEDGAADVALARRAARRARPGRQAAPRWPRDSGNSVARSGTRSA